MYRSTILGEYNVCILPHLPLLLKHCAIIIKILLLSYYYCLAAPLYHHLQHCASELRPGILSQQTEVFIEN